MVKKLLVFILFWTGLLKSQNILKIEFVDGYKKPVSHVNIKFSNQFFNTNEAASITILNYITDSKINIHKLGFADTNFSVHTKPVLKDTVYLFITLRLNPTNLPEVPVVSSYLKEENVLNAHFILGYELKNEYLIQLLSNDIVIVTDEKNEIQFRSSAIKNTSDIVKDAYGDVYIVTDKKAFKLVLENGRFAIDTVAFDLKKLKWNLSYCDEVCGTSLFIRRYKDNNQAVGFFGVSRKDNNHVTLLKEITDEERKKAVNLFSNETKTFNYYLESRNLSKVTATNEGEIKLVRKGQKMRDALEMNYILPSYTFLKLINDTVYLFAHDIDTMFVYDTNLNLIKSKRINYHHLKTWGKELIVNEEKTRVYAKLIDDSKPILVEINLQNGQLEASGTPILAKFPNKIKIKNSTIYFMNKQKSGVGSSVYSQALGN